MWLNQYRNPNIQRRMRLPWPTSVSSTARKLFGRSAICSNDFFLPPYLEQILIGNKRIAFQREFYVISHTQLTIKECLAFIALVHYGTQYVHQVYQDAGYLSKGFAEYDALNTSISLINAKWKKWLRCFFLFSFIIPNFAHRMNVLETLNKEK